jgi:hypothetical protein
MTFWTGENVPLFGLSWRYGGEYRWAVPILVTAGLFSRL